MAKNDILITFAIGRNVGKFNATNSDGAKALSKAVANAATALAVQSTKFQIQQLTARLSQTVETAYTQAVQYAANNMIGRQSRGIPNIPISINFLQVASWKPLSKRQVMKQNGGKPGVGKFFHDTGALKKTLLTFARKMVRNTGVVKIQIMDADKGGWKSPSKKDSIIPISTLSVDQSLNPVTGKIGKGKKIPVSNIKLILLPNAYASQSPGLKSGKMGGFDSSMKFETMLGLSPEAITKLRGPVIPNQGDIYHRPLLQPVFSYWTFYKIPQVIQDALINNIFVPDRSEAGGIADYSQA